jgi:tRNA pseudouridine38-40 synthase
MRYALGLEYDGTPFAGWQTQPPAAHVQTVQDVLQGALSQIASEPVEVFCSGRTDAGVHALQQVLHFDTTATRPDQAWIRGLNSLLPKTVAVRWAQCVDGSFHARHSALERRYTYALLSDAVRPSRSRHQVGWVHHPLNLSAMQQAAALLVGEHDFSSYRASQCQAKGPVRRISELTLVQHGTTVFLTFQANGFLHHMVRNIVGALVYVGIGRWTVAQFKAVFDARDRTVGAPTFAPDGLYFCGATYPAEMNIPMPLALGILGNLVAA